MSRDCSLNSCSDYRWAAGAVHQTHSAGVADRECRAGVNESGGWELEQTDSCDTQQCFTWVKIKVTEWYSKISLFSLVEIWYFFFILKSISFCLFQFCVMELIKWMLMEEKEQSSGAVPATIAVTSDTRWSTRFAIYVVKCRTSPDRKIYLCYRWPLAMLQLSGALWMWNEYTFDCFPDNLL